MKYLIIVGMFAALLGCKEDKGLHTGAALQDCASIAPNQREDAARTIKGLSKEDAAAALAQKFSISESAARECLK